MAETFWNYDWYIDQIDVKDDKIPDWFNENQIKDKARNYVENRIKEWISEEEYDKLLEWVKKLLERQDVERIDLIQELRQREIWETREEVDKEALIQEAKAMIYEKIWISENQENNNWLENFLKWIIDELVIWNYELAIEIYNTNWAIIIDSLKQLASLEWLKKMAESLWETLWNLVDWNAYEKWKSVAQLWLIWTWAWVWFALWKKWLKLWMRELAKLRPHTSKESIVASPEIKLVIKETWGKVDEIVPKQEVKTVETARKIDIERQIRWLEQLWLTESFTRDILESWLMNEKFLWGDLLRRFEDLHKKWIDYNRIIDEAIKQTPNLSREEALLIFSYTDNTIYRRLNDFMRWNKEVLQSLTSQNIEATQRLVSRLEQALEKMPNMNWELVYRWDNWKWWKWNIWDEIDLKAFTSVANATEDTFLWNQKDILVIIQWKDWRVKDITKLALIPNFWEHFPKIPKTSNEWVVLPNSKVIIVWNDKWIYKWIDITEVRVKQTK